MISGQPSEVQFFLDRSLGGVQVPRLLRAAGLTVVTLTEYYGNPADESVTDVEWLELAGRRHWPVLMKDTKIRYRQAEREALINHNVQAFCLTNANLNAAKMADEFLTALARIHDAIKSASPCLYAVSRGRIKRLDLI